MSSTSKINRPRFLQLLLLACMLLLSGCSSLLVRGLHAPAEEKALFVSSKSDEIEGTVWFPPHSIFLSVGVPVLPIIPVYIGGAGTGELELKAVVKMYRDVDFSFASAPCLMTDETRMLCPESVEVAAAAQVREGMFGPMGEQWNEATPLDAAANRIVVSLPKTGERIGRSEIFRKYGYERLPPWAYLKIDLLYRYRCENGRCPDRFVVPLKDLGIVHGKPLWIRDQTFERRREFDYEFL